MEKKYVGALDQGTTSTRFILFNHDGEIAYSHQIEHKQSFPQPGWVEHDPLEIWENSKQVIQETLKKADATAGDIASIGITNQRETTVVWNPETGQPYYPAIVWQDTRTSKICDRLAQNGDMYCYRDKVGLPLTTYFAGPKFKWMQENVPEVQEALKQKKIMFGTIDSWLLWNLSGGKDGGVHITDVTNASRTMMMNIDTLQWDEEMVEIMGGTMDMMPEIRSSSEIYAETPEKGPLGGKVPLAGILGDQQAALFGQTCYHKGEAKNTYGTGCFLLMNTGNQPIKSKFGLLTTVGYKLGNEPAVYSLEGSIAMSGSLIQWARDNLKLFDNAPEIDQLASQVEDTAGVYIVPAFSGLFAPRWRKDARGVIVGLTHYAKKEHICRAILEASAYQAREIFDAMQKDSGIELKTLKVDGGMTVSEPLMKFQADILGVPVQRPKIKETTALGSAYAAGLAAGFWKNLDELRDKWSVNKEWEPHMDEAKREKLYAYWCKAVERTYDWVDPEE